MGFLIYLLGVVDGIRYGLIAVGGENIEMIKCNVVIYG